MNKSPSESGHKKKKVEKAASEGAPEDKQEKVPKKDGSMTDPVQNQQKKPKRKKKTDPEAAAASTKSTQGDVAKKAEGKKAEKKPKKEEAKSAEPGKEKPKGENAKENLGERAAGIEQRRDLSLEYLSKWKNNRSNWRFLKGRQNWLLHNMYDPKMIDDANFELLLEYLEGLKGTSRKVTIDVAKNIVDAVKGKAEFKNLDKRARLSSDPGEKQHDRAQRLIKLF